MPAPPPLAPRQTLQEVFEAALDAVRGDRAVARVLEAERGDRTSIDVLAAGKAAPSMARPVAAVYGDRLVRGLVVTKDASDPAPARLQVLRASHPVPDHSSLRAGRRWLECASACPPERGLLVLLSGGASALLGCPAPGLALQDLQVVTDLLLRAGADIEALNAVRKHLGAVGGGRSLEMSRSRDVQVLALSDVPGDRLDLIGSGPFCADPHRYRDALAVLDRLGLGPRVPAAVLEHLRAGARGEHPETLKPGDPALARVHHRVVASLGDALRAAERAAERLGLRVEPWPTRLAGEAREEASRLARAAREAGPGTCIISGGEPVVTVRGGGRGGRAQELALALAIELDGIPGVVALAAGTDGSDGPTDAAGAWADGGSVARGRAAGVDARAALDANDSHGFFAAEGGLLRTGPTGTNVNDLVLVATL